MADLAANELERFFWRLDRRHEDDAIAAADDHGERIGRSRRLDERLDDRGLQGRVGAFLDKVGIEGHGRIPA